MIELEQGIESRIGLLVKEVNEVDHPQTFEAQCEIIHRFLLEELKRAKRE